MSNTSDDFFIFLPFIPRIAPVDSTTHGLAPRSLEHLFAQLGPTTGQILFRIPALEATVTPVAAPGGEALRRDEK